MNPKEALVQAFETSFNHNFDFYNKGKIHPSAEKLKQPTVLEFTDKIGIGFRIIDSDKGVHSFLLFVFDQGLELEMYLEMGNIFASRLASNSKSDQILFPTAPQIYREKQIKAVLSSFSTRKRMFHSYQGKMIAVDLLLCKNDPIPEGHA